MISSSNGLKPPPAIASISPSPVSRSKSLNRPSSAYIWTVELRGKLAVVLWESRLSAPGDRKSAAECPTRVDCAGSDCHIVGRYRRSQFATWIVFRQEHTLYPRIDDVVDRRRMSRLQYNRYQCGKTHMRIRCSRINILAGTYGSSQVCCGSG